MDAMMMDAMSKDMTSMPGMESMDMATMQACMDACSAAEQATTICATQMMDCAPACMNCADMCHTTMRSMMRMQGMTPAAIQRPAQASRDRDLPPRLPSNPRPIAEPAPDAPRVG